MDNTAPATTTTPSPYLLTALQNLTEAERHERDAQRAFEGIADTGSMDEVREVYGVLERARAATKNWRDAVAALTR